MCSARDGSRLLLHQFRLYCIVLYWLSVRYGLLHILRYPCSILIPRLVPFYTSLLASRAACRRIFLSSIASTSDSPSFALPQRTFLATVHSALPREFCPALGSIALYLLQRKSRGPRTGQETEIPPGWVAPLILYANPKRLQLAPSRSQGPIGSLFSTSLVLLAAPRSLGVQQDIS